MRATLAVFSSFCEARFYRSVGENMNDHIARYLLFMLLFSPGMWNASSGEKWIAHLIGHDRLTVAKSVPPIELCDVFHYTRCFLLHEAAFYVESLAYALRGSLLCSWCRCRLAIRIVARSTLCSRGDFCLGWRPCSARRAALVANGSLETAYIMWRHCEPRVCERNRKSFTVFH